MCPHLPRSFYFSSISVLFSLQRATRSRSYQSTFFFIVVPDQSVHLVLVVPTFPRGLVVSVLNSFLGHAHPLAFRAAFGSAACRRSSTGPVPVVHIVHTRHNNSRFHKSEQAREKVPYSPDLPS